MNELKLLITCRKKHGAWSMEHGAWSMGHGAWGMGHGAWGMGHGAWGMEQRDLMFVKKA
jgi:hypothetical protein